MLLDKIEELKHQGLYDEALKLANQVLSKNPANKEALLQIADIEYRKGEIARAEKPIDFMLTGLDEDAMGLYVKGVLEMEKTNWNNAKGFLRRAVAMLEEENPEVLRCYGLCEYWSGNREDGIQHLKKAFDLNNMDAEIILNLIEIMVIEEKSRVANRYIKHYHNSKKNLQFFEREVSYYDQKIRVFEEYIRSNSQE